MKLRQTMIPFRGQVVVQGWPKQLSDAQKVKYFTLESGEKINRVRYNPDEDDCLCHDCAAKKGEYHVPGCDMERCGKCSGQWISCDCVNEDSEDTED